MHLVMKGGTASSTITLYVLINGFRSVSNTVLAQSTNFTVPGKAALEGAVKPVFNLLMERYVSSKRQILVANSI